MIAILDTRTVADFQKNTFSGYSRAMSIKSLQESLRDSNADYACFWALELLCSGLVNSLWITMFISYATYVGRANPNLSAHLISQYERFRSIQNGFTTATMTLIRNHTDARMLVCESAAAISIARKQKPPTLPVIKPLYDFDAKVMRNNTRATSARFGNGILKPSDPYELQIPLNELCYSVQNRDTLQSLYWVSWIGAFARERKKTSRQDFVIAPREGEFILPKYSQNLVWLFWDVVHHFETPGIKMYIESLEKMYCLNWEPAVAKAHQPILLTVFVFLTEGASLDTREPLKREEIERIVTGVPRWLDTIQTTRTNVFTH